MVLKSKQSNTFFLHCQFLLSKNQSLHDDVCLIDPLIISFDEESLLHALLYGSDSVFRKLIFIPLNLSLKAEPHAKNYRGSHPEVICKKVCLEFLENSQENSSPGVYFSCTFNKKEALAQMVSCEFSEIGLTPKYKKQMFANVS